MKRGFWKTLVCAGLISTSFSFSGTVEAGIVTDRFPIQMYVDHQLNTYTNRGDANRAGWADANTDLIRVYEVNNGWARVSHPGRNGTVDRWCKVNELFADPNYSNRGVKVKGAQQVFRTQSTSATIGSVSNNEDVIVLADNGSRAQIIYRLDNGTGYKIGWVPSATVASSGTSSSKGNGDVDGDGQATKADVDMLLAYVQGKRSSLPRPNNADMNGDGNINILDVTTLNNIVRNASQTTNTAHNPEGYFDSVVSNSANQITVRGWALDRDNTGAQLEVHVYVGGGAGSGAPSYRITANKHRPDVNRVHSGVGEYHGFEDTITVNRTGNQSIYVYAINVGGGQNIELGHKTVNIVARSTTNNNNNTNTRTIINSSVPVPMSNGWYKIHPAHDTARSLDAAGKATGQGNNVHLWSNANVSQQKFYLENRGNNLFSLRSEYGSGYYITVVGNGNGANLETRPWNGSAAQLFQVVSGGKVNGQTTYHIMAKVGGNLNFDCAGGGKSDGNNAQLWTKETGSNWHKWIFEPTRATQAQTNTNTTTRIQTQTTNTNTRINPSTSLVGKVMVAKQTVPAYTNSALTTRQGNERVDKGDNCRVIAETAKSYYVHYPVTNSQGRIIGYKDRYVSKDIFEEPTGGNTGGGMITQNDNGAYWASMLSKKVTEANNSDCYQKPANPFNKSYRSSKDNSYHPTNCTWYAWGRMKEVTGKALNVTGNAWEWHNTNGANCRIDHSLESKCVAEMVDWKGHPGHVVFVEYVDDRADCVYYTEANWGGNDFKVKKLSIGEFKERFSWFIHP